VIKFIDPDDSFCFRALHTVYAVFYDDDGRLTARVTKKDGSLYAFEIKSFHLPEAGRVYP
jgi:hypothetical protein